MSTMTNKQGFPIETCDRCQGSGQYSFHLIHGTMCFNCNGEGTRIVKRARQAWKMYQQELWDLKHTPVSRLQVGDIIAHEKVWRRVSAIDVGDRVCHWRITGKDENGNDVMEPKCYMIVLTIEALHKGDVHLPEAKRPVHCNGEARLNTSKVDASKYLAMIPNERGEQ
jgi:hypothetical protein